MLRPELIKNSEDNVINFVLSQVTAEIHATQTVFIQLIVICVSLGGVCRAALGPLPFWAAFAFTEIFKISACFCFGHYNADAFLQMALITNIG